MTLEDFRFDGECLSDRGYMPCDINSNTSSTSLGSVLKLSTVENFALNRFPILDTNYETPLEATIDICRTPCEYTTSEMIFGEQEIRDLTRWLNRKRYKRLYPIYDSADYAGIYFNATADTISPIIIGGEIYGLSIHFTMDAAWGYIEKPTRSFENVTSFSLGCDSDTEGSLYPSKVTIEILEDGDFVMSNTLDSQSVEILNCTAGEVIVFDCENKIVTSVSHDNIYKDFNYKYPRLIVTYKDSINKFETTLRCNISFNYSVVRKVGVLQ